MIPQNPSGLSLGKNSQPPPHEKGGQSSGIRHFPRRTPFIFSLFILHLLIAEKKSSKKFLHGVSLGTKKYTPEIPLD
jgi:hypothetical protein